MSLSQAEIDALLGVTGSLDDDESGEPAPAPVSRGEYHGERELTPKETDILGEVGNICMGRAAKTMSEIVNRRVNITTPRVSVYSTAEVLAEYQVPFVVVEVEYVEGMRGKNLLLLHEHDAARITDIMLGGDGDVPEGQEMGEMEISAIKELMNQMVASSSHAMANIIGTPVNIDPPFAERIGVDSDVSGRLDYSDLVVKIKFDMEVEGLFESQLLQLMPLEIGRDLAKTLFEAMKQEEEQTASASPAPKPASPPPPAPKPAAPVAAPVLFEPLNSIDYGEYGLVSDIPLSVSVELGRTTRAINDILGFGLGSVVVLDKINGDPVEMYVNGKLIARGEVVQMGENYGVRVLEVMNN